MLGWATVGAAFGLAYWAVKARPPVDLHDLLVWDAYPELANPEQ